VSVGQFSLLEGARKEIKKINQTLNNMAAQFYGAYSFIAEGIFEDIKSEVPIH
jgi:hypothetical protein